MGQITVTLDRTLEKSKPLDEYDPVSETRKLFPSAVSMNGKIMDGWGRPIVISIKRIEKGFEISLASAGPDGIMHTENDLSEEMSLSDEPVQNLTRPEE